MIIYKMMDNVNFLGHASMQGDCIREKSNIITADFADYR
jgi:hypothetical protein